MKTAKHMGKLMLLLCLGLTTTLAYAETGNNSLALVEKLNSEWNAHFNNADLESLVRLYAEDATISPGNGKTLQGHRDIQDLFSGFLANGLHNHTIDTISSFRQGNAITQIARWQAIGQAADGYKPVYGGILVNVFKLDEKGNWKTYLHLWNMSS